MLVYADRVKETTGSAGTVTLNLAGAISGFQAFIDGIGSANTCEYCLLSGNGTDWEVGLGTVTSGSPNTLSRDVIYASSNSGSKISLTGTSTVFGDAPARAISSIGPAPISKTANYLLVTKDRGSHFDITGASGTVVFTLPAATGSGFEASFAVTSAHILEVLCAGTDQVSDGSNNSAAGGNIQSNSEFATLRLKDAVSGQWVVISATGGWIVT